MVDATPLMTHTATLGLSIRLSMFELRETGDWDIFLGPLERARAETGGSGQWVLKRRECSGFVRVNKVSFASLGYPLSVFNKHSTLKAEGIPRGYQGLFTPLSLGYPLSVFNKKFTLKLILVPTSEIKDLYATLNNNFHVPSPHSLQNPHCHHYHILTSDFNSWVGTEREQYLANHLGYPHIPTCVGDPHPR